MKVLKTFSLIFLCTIIGIFSWYFLIHEKKINPKAEIVLRDFSETLQEELFFGDEQEIFSQTKEEILREYLRQEADYITENELDGELYITITDIENCNIYINEEYGFSFNFPAREEGGDTCKALKVISLNHDGAIFVRFNFLLPDDPKKGNGLNSNPVGLYNTPLFTVDGGDPNYNIGPIPAFGWYSGFGLEIIDESGYQDPIWENYIGGREYMEQNIIGKNDQYYFLVWWYPEYRYFDLGYGGSTEINDIANYITIFDKI